MRHRVGLVLRTVYSTIYVSARSIFRFEESDPHPTQLLLPVRLLILLTASVRVGIISNMGAVELLRTRIIFSEIAFAELVLWRGSTQVHGSTHDFKYLLAYVVNQV